MPLVNDRASAEAILRRERSDRVVHGVHEIHAAAALEARPPRWPRPSTLRSGLGQSAKQLLNR